MKKIISIILALTLFLLCFSGCEKNGSEDLMADITEGTELLMPLTLPEQIAKDHNISATSFGLRLFQKNLVSDENILISPLSVLYALSMTANGADGETLAQMEAVLGQDIDTLNQYLAEYMANLSGEELQVANSIWLRDMAGLAVERSFLQTNEEYYDAGVFKAAFDDQTCSEINRWVTGNTNGMIPKILDEIPEEAVMYLINAMAFEAAWQSVYEENQVHEGQFTTADGTSVTVDFMYSTEYNYLEDENATGFIKYFEGKKYAFAALLPNEGLSIAAYAATLTPQELTAMLCQPQSRTVETGLPMFETKYDTDLNTALKSMGMTDAFSSTDADFSKMANCDAGNLFIGRVIHSTYLTVGARGAKAGAATAVQMDYGMALEPEQIKTVILDRPFVYVLIDCETGLPLFMGTMLDPSR